MLGGELRHVRHVKDLGLKFLAIDQLLKEPSQLQRKVFIFEVWNPPRQGQNILKVSNGFDQIVSETNQQHVDSVGTRMIAPMLLGLR